MTIEQLRDKILNDRRLVFECDFIDRDFSFQEMRGMATVLLGARRVGKSWFMRHYARCLISNGLSEEKVCYLSFFGLEDEDIRFSMIEQAYYSMYPEFDTDNDVWFL